MTIQFKQWESDLVVGHYSNGRIAIELIDPEDGEPIAVATVNIPEVHISDDEVIIKDYSENEGMYDLFVKEGLIFPETRRIRTGFVTVPVCKITEKLKGIIDNISNKE